MASRRMSERRAMHEPKPRAPGGAPLRPSRRSLYRSLLRVRECAQSRAKVVVLRALELVRESVQLCLRRRVLALVAVALRAVDELVDLAERLRVDVLGPHELVAVR